MKSASLLRQSRSALLLLCLVAASCARGGRGGSDSRPELPHHEAWISLFNGQDLEGWTPKFSGHELGENYLDTFRVEGGVLKVSYDQYSEFDGKFGHAFYRTPFSHYRLRAEYRFVGDQAEGGPGWAFRNNGFMVHCQAPETMRVAQDFPASIEVQLLGGPGGESERPTLNLCTPGTNVVRDGELFLPHVLNSSSRTFHGDQWVSVEVEVRGNRVIRHLIDGEVVLEYTLPQLDERDSDAQRLLADGATKLLESGYIAIQAESHPIEFRRIEILVLDPNQP